MFLMHPDIFAKYFWWGTYSSGSENLEYSQKSSFFQSDRKQFLFASNNSLFHDFFQGAND